MRFSKQERKILNDLSMQLFGSSSKWQKLLNVPEFRVVIGVEENPNAQKYVSLANSKKNGSSGTVIRLEKAIEKGLFKSEKGEKNLEEIMSKNVKNVKSRTPTFEELRDALIDNIDIQKLSMCDKHELATIVAYRIIKNTLNLTIVLDITEEEKVDFDQILSSLPEELQEKIKKYIPDKDQEKNPNALPINGLEMIKEIVYALKDMDMATNEYLNILNEKVIVKKTNPDIVDNLPLNQYINKLRRNYNKTKKNK